MKFFDTYYFNYFKYLISGRQDSIMIDFYRKKNIKIGNDCHIYSNICTPEAYLITIGDNVTIAPGSKFLTHDNSVSKVIENVTDVFGRITVEDNVFIGANSIILPGVRIGRNSIVAAGSVVSKSVPEGVVVGGNPAKVICTIDEYVAKVTKYSISTKGLSPEEKRVLLLSTDKLISK